MSSSCGSCPSKSTSCGAGDAQAQMQAKVAQLDAAIKISLGKIKNKILVMSGKGGVGKSTVATNLALGLANRGKKVGLLDVDLHGPDICRMLNLTDNIEDAEKTGKLVPTMQYGDNLKVISLEYMMADRDAPIIWRGPLKNQAIRQFIGEMDWGELDFLVIDAPPGTGDEPMTIAHTIPDARALVVTTPQDVALADVRKSITFCSHVKMDVLGLVENMSGFICPHCDKTVDIFKSGGGEVLAREFSIPFLGRIPVDPRVVLGGDDGSPYLTSDSDSAAVKSFNEVVDKVLDNSNTATPLETVSLANASTCGCGPDGCDPDKCDC